MLAKNAMTTRLKIQKFHKTTHFVFHTLQKSFATQTNDVEKQENSPSTYFQLMLNALH